MKQILILCLLISHALDARAQNMPSYETIVNTFFDTYSISNIEINQRIGFEKRFDGWYVSLNEIGEKETKSIKQELFWDDTFKYNRLSFSKKNRHSGNDIRLRNGFLDERNISLYNICPIYGYQGWDRHLIDEFSNIKNLSDTLLYAVGRAYSSYASRLLYPRKEYIELKHQFNLPEGKNCLTDKQLKRYRLNRHQAIAFYEKVEKKNPSFETFVGSINTKVSNEYLTAYLDIKIHQNKKEALKELKHGLYSDFMISTAQNYLMACESNAILFTRGDNDTYPLLYVQAKYGFRTDVRVINLGLLLENRYANDLRDAEFNQKAIGLTLTPEEIKGKSREVVLVKEQMKSINIRDMIRFVKSDHTKTKMKVGDENYHFVPSKNIILEHRDESIEWIVPTGHILRNHLIMLDVISQNDWQRPVYFTSTMQTKEYFGLNPYFENNGLVYKLISKKKNKYRQDFDHVNTNVLYNILMYRNNWSGLNKKNRISDNIYGAYTQNFHELVEAYIDEEELEKAVEVLDRYVQVFSNDIKPYNYHIYFIIKDYYILGEVEKANEMARLLIENYNTLYYSNGNYIKERSTEERYLVHIVSLLKRHGQHELLKGLKVPLEEK
ncbi:MAG: hypothetical protein ACPG6V_02105 [Flavobacteriales bacterium]